MSPIHEEDMQRQNDILREAARLFDDSGTASDRYKEKLNALNREFQGTANAIRNNFSKALNDAVARGESFTTVFQKLRVSLEELALNKLVVNPISDALFGGTEKTANNGGGNSGSGILSALTSTIADLFGARAFGGPVGAGTPYLVGERGPELFVPQVAGKINPNTSSAGINITMNISAQDAASFRASEAQIAAAMMDAARRAQRIR